MDISWCFFLLGSSNHCHAFIQQAKESWEMDTKEKLEQAAIVKEKGTVYFKVRWLFVRYFPSQRIYSSISELCWYPLSWILSVPFRIRISLNFYKSVIFSIRNGGRQHSDENIIKKHTWLLSCFVMKLGTQISILRKNKFIYFTTKSNLFATKKSFTF